jgi:hypothetical protein
MVTTVLQATVSEEKWNLLEEIYDREISNLPPTIVQTSLLQGTQERTIWQIVTVWKSREALDEMRSSGETPAGVRMFRMAGAEPGLTIFDVIATAPGK